MLGEEAVEVGKPVAAAVSETHRDEHDVDRVDERKRIRELRQRRRVDDDDVSLSLELVDDFGDPPRLEQVDRSRIAREEEAQPVAVTGRVHERVVHRRATEEKVGEPAGFTLTEDGAHRRPPEVGVDEDDAQSLPPAPSPGSPRSSSSLGLDCARDEHRARRFAAHPARRQAGAQVR